MINTIRKYTKKQKITMLCYFLFTETVRTFTELFKILGMNLNRNDLKLSEYVSKILVNVGLIVISTFILPFTVLAWFLFFTVYIIVGADQKGENETKVQRELRLIIQLTPMYQ